MRSWGSVTTATVLGGALLPVVALLVIARLGGTPPGGSRTESGTPKSSADNVSLTASATDLYPGAVRPLWVKVTNPHSFPIVVDRIVVRELSDPSRPGCSAATYLRTADLAGPLKVRARSSARATLAIRLLSGAPDGCKRAEFPLHVIASAAKS